MNVPWDKIAATSWKDSNLLGLTRDQRLEALVWKVLLHPHEVPKYVNLRAFFPKIAWLVHRHQDVTIVRKAFEQFCQELNQLEDGLGRVAYNTYAVVLRHIQAREWVNHYNSSPF